MCTVVILRRPAHDWPLLLAANRDEMRERPWAPPARHWPDRSHVVAGIDLEASGTWLGVNDDGLTAAVLNRPQSLGQDAGGQHPSSVHRVGHDDAQSPRRRGDRRDAGGERLNMTGQEVGHGEGPLRTMALEQNATTGGPGCS